MRTLLVLALLTTLLGLALQLPGPPPPGAVGPYFNGTFSPTAPGSNWGLEDAYPDLTFNGPVRVLPAPEGDGAIWVLCKVGEVWRVSADGSGRTLLLDIKDRAFSLGEAGTTGMALHPRFGDPAYPDQQQLFLFYRSKPQAAEWSERGYNRLAKFSWDAAAGRFDADSEEILIQQYDRYTWHNGGGLFFGQDGFLYLSLGDEGADDHQVASTQRLDGGLFSGVLRIDVDNDPARSHPIRRQPLANATPIDNWDWPTYTQGYSIPNDNPWPSPDSSTLEEFYAIGVRSPYGMSYDAASDQIWLADVGASTREEINLVARGDNYQWPYLEGSFASETHARPADPIGTERPPFFEYARDVGACVIGGNVYRGTRFSGLNGKYVFADFTAGKILALDGTTPGATPTLEVLVPSITDQPVPLPDKPLVTGVFPLPDGQIVLTVLSENERGPGRLYRLRALDAVPEPPARLSELGIFTDLATLTPATGVVSYGVNSPLWSDRAAKQRWLILPNDGRFDSPAEQIGFQRNGEWTFPEGTVFVKHFELPLTTDGDGPHARLETRFFIVGEGGRGYGLSYQWNEAGTDALLLGGGTSRSYDIYEAGEWAYTQQWDFPSRAQCLTCHNANAGYVLGVKTHQLNGEHYYASTGATANQLAYLSNHNVFSPAPPDPAELPRAAAVDDPDAPLDHRVRSYLDSNCASCHRPGGVPMLTMDLRFGIPLSLCNIVNNPTRSQASTHDRSIVEPGNHAVSELWVRDASEEANRMPPIGRHLVDEPYVAALADWIDGLDADAGRVSESLVYPNPTTGLVSLRLPDDWAPPFHIQVFDAQGRSVRDHWSGVPFYIIDLGALPVGSYLVRYSNASERRSQLVLKQ